MKENESLKLQEEFPPVSTAQWEEAVRKDLKGGEPSKLVWKTEEGIAVKPFYRSADLQELDAQLSPLPGEFPFVRGTRAGNNWSIRQAIDVADPQLANEAAREALANGAESICFEVVPEGSAVRGVAVQSSEDMRKLIAGLPVRNAAICFRAQRAARAILLLYLSELSPAADPTGSVDFDPLGDLLVEGTSARAGKEIFADAAEVLKFAAEAAPRLRTLAVRGRQVPEAGGTVVQELAFSLAAGVEYLSEFAQHGLSTDEVCSKIFFSFATGSNYFFEIAKLRAFRMMWAQAVEQYKPKHVDSAAAVIESVTSRWGMTVYDAHNNLLRATTEAMSAAIGGCDAIEVVPFDAPFKSSDLISRRLSRNTQIVLKKEAYLDRVVDPGGGSYYIEVLTHSLAREAWKLFQQVEGKGGFLKAIEGGFVQQEIRNSRQHKDEAVASRRRNLLGTNQFPNQNEQALEKFDLHGNLTPLRASGAKPAAAPAELAKQFSGGLTLGDCLAYTQPALTVEKLALYRGAEPFESLRLRAELHAAKAGRKLRVLLLEYGDLKMRKARVGFSQNFVAEGGFEVVVASCESNPDAAAKVVEAQHPALVVLCSADEEYPPMARPLIEKLGGAKAIPVVVAGFPKDSIEQLKQDGVADFIHVRSNALEVLTRWQQQLGITE